MSCSVRVNRAGLSRIVSGTATFPISCTTPARRNALISGAESPICSPNLAEYSAKRAQWPSVYGSFSSMLRASANSTASARSNSSVNAFCRNSDRTRAINCSRFTGLHRKSSAPAWIPVTRSSVAVNPVIRTTGTSNVSGLFFIRRHTSVPRMFGMLMSSSSKSGWVRRNCSSACIPSSAVSTL